MSLGTDFAEALSRKDFDAVAALLHPEVDFRAMTPRLSWEAGDPEELVAKVLREWFGDDHHFDEVLGIETGTVADTERVGYRFRGRNPDGEFVVEQQAYLRERDGQIGWLRIMCSGMRPASPAAPTR